jgi:hypothetical protein
VLTPRDLENPDKPSGYKFVNSANAGENGHGQSGQFWRAERWVQSPARHKWAGPARREPIDAAQDYCDWANNSGVSHTTLKSAGHTGRRPKLPDDPEVQAAIGVIRDARGAQQGNQGYVYLICEEAYDGSIDLLRGYGKIGFSTNPEARVAELQTGNPRKLRLCAYFPGDADDERETQRKWIDYNVLQEWFRLTPPLWSSFIHRKDAIIK